MHPRNAAFKEAFHDIRRLVQKYQYVAMDTEFPGVVARPIGEFRSASDYQHQLLRCNVDMLKIIQVGARMPGCVCARARTCVRLSVRM